MKMAMRGRGLLGLASRVAGTKAFSTEIFVSRLSFYTTDEEFKNTFSPFGAIEEGDLCFSGTISSCLPQGNWFLGNMLSRFSFCILSIIVRLMRDNQTGRPKGFGFVKYSSQEAAEKAVKAMDGRIIRGRLIFVETAKERDSG
uniref:Uncharacterized protein n=1 Tax=Avena sativa TaxID=4498 RepID=A0ACD5Y5S3_AVESA